MFDYLDTGLFLDHRPLRGRIQAEAQGKRFLNLFCYTGVASVQAGLGGARFSTSVDLSNTYLDWFRENLASNGLAEAKHRAIRSDVMTWLAQETSEYDLILLDPPTFSNSKSTLNHFDVQRDHVELIVRSMARLATDGVLYFSNNLLVNFMINNNCKTHHGEEINFYCDKGTIHVNFNLETVSVITNLLQNKISRSKEVAFCI